MTKHLLYKSILVLVLGLLVFPLSGLARDGSSTSIDSQIIKAADSETSATTTSTDNTEIDIKGTVRPEQEAVDTALGEYEGTKGQIESRRVTALTKLGDRAISERQKALTNLSTLLSKGRCANINSAVKAVLQADIDRVVTNLASQKVSLDDDKTLGETKTDVKAVFTKNLTFINLVPAIKGACAAERIIELTSSTRISNIITTLQTAGVDVTQLSTDLTAARTSAQAALVLYEKVATDPSNLNATAKTDLQTATSDMVNAKQSLAAAKNDLEVALADLDKTAATENSTDNSALNSGNGSSTTH